MNRLSLWLALLAICLGCRSISPYPDKAIISQFESVDLLEISRDKQKIEITDPQEIQKLKQIYAEAKWSPYAATMPSGMIHIDCKQGDKTLFSLLHGTWLIEWSKDTGPVRKAKLDGEAVAWMQELTDELKRVEKLEQE